MAMELNTVGRAGADEPRQDQSPKANFQPEQPNPPNGLQIDALTGASAPAPAQRLSTRLSTRNFDAVVFDLDGVVTSTAKLHFRAWKQAFDDYLNFRAQEYNENHREFTVEDYEKYVDGKDRYVGCQAFLRSRAIQLPWGQPGSEEESVCGIADRKNMLYNQLLDSEPITVFHSSVKIMRELKDQGIKVAIATSSRNCDKILERTGLQGIAEVIVDGRVSQQLGLKSKPAPDIFRAACEQLGVPCHRAVVVEDAVSGVQAGKAGNFGLVIGIARNHNEAQLKRHGADIVVRDMEEMPLEGLDHWFDAGLVEDGKTISFHDYGVDEQSVRSPDELLKVQKDQVRGREALMAFGNGYICTRAAMVETPYCPGDHQFAYPATYMAGVYNQLPSTVEGRLVWNEDLVRCINWTPITFKINDGPWFDPNKMEILRLSRALHMGTGDIIREMVVKDSAGHETAIVSRGCAGMHNPHLLAQRYTVTPLNYSARISIRFGLHGDHINDGVDRYRKLNQQHLEPVSQQAAHNQAVLVVRTTQSKITMAAAMKVTAFLDSKELIPRFIHTVSEGRIDGEFSWVVEKGQSLTLHKVVGMYTSRDSDNPEAAAQHSILRIKKYGDVHNPSADAWKKIWDRVDIELVGDRETQKLIRLNLYHTIISASPHNVNIDASVGARGLTGEAYRGHVFWDEAYILPLIAVQQPEVARALLMYRYNRLDAARSYAQENGYQGAMFPWQSGSDGSEQTQVVHFNPISGNWDPDYSRLQRHVSLAIAYNVWQYFWLTEDRDFLNKYGAEMYFEICRFWASAAKLDPQSGRWSIEHVMGPDEFHEKYPDAKEGGLRDNAYTNIMASWVLQQAPRIAEDLDEEGKVRVFKTIGLTEEEIAQWQTIARGLKLKISRDGIIEQFDGFFALKPVDPELLCQAHGRVDRVLKAQGRSPDEHQVAKQADLLMAPYWLGADEVARVCRSMGYHLQQNWLVPNFDFYLYRTSHGSTLSRLVHSVLAHHKGDWKLGLELFRDALRSDMDDIQGGTTGEGIHLGVMAGTVWQVISCFAGVDFRDKRLAFDPRLPTEWKELKFKVQFKGHLYSIKVRQETLEVTLEGAEDKKVHILVREQPELLEGGKARVFEL